MSRVPRIAGLAWACLHAFGAPAAFERCAPCHPKQVESYARTAMANSIGSPDRQPPAAFDHRVSSSRIRIETAAAGMKHMLERDGLNATHNIDYFIGSGARGRSYIVGLRGRLFQSPASFYSARRSWDVSPGFEAERDLDFDRPIPLECLFCHSGAARPVPFTINTYRFPPFEQQPITCERCHDASESHIEKPSKSNIVNPAKLAPALRDAVCEQCHLGGEARIPNPGRSYRDFRPGEALERSFTVYVFDRPPSAADAPFKVVSHSEQLAMSECAKKSGTRMWCGACHDPHETPAEPESYYSNRCRECHSERSLAKHRRPAADCAGCHMPKRASYDGGHTAFTDHRIRAKPALAGLHTPLPNKLRPWRQSNTAFAQRNLGLAHISVGERYQSAVHLNQGFRHLSAVQSTFADDPAVLTALGVVFERKRLPREAARLFLRASQLEPQDARHRLNLGIALLEAGAAKEAVTTLKVAIELDESLLEAYLLLAQIYHDSGAAQARSELLEKYLNFMPQSISVRKMLIAK